MRRRGTEPMKNLGYIYIAVMLGLFILIGMISDGDSQEEREAKKCENSTMAYVYSQDFVRDRLRAPSTADFPLLEFSAVHLGDCRHRIAAYVDAQNAFGGTIRSPYTAVVSYDGNGTWHLESLYLD